MKQPIDRKQFLQRTISALAALFLNACKRAITPAPAPAWEPTEKAITGPSVTPAPSDTPMPPLPDFCRPVLGEATEVYLFGKKAIRVSEIELGVYQIIIDRNIDAGVFRADIEYTLLAELNRDLPYFILWLNQERNIQKVFEAS